MNIQNTINNNIATIIGVMTIVGSLSGALIWANDNLASKDDILHANVLSEFRSIELHLSLNDYRLSEIEYEVDAATAEAIANGGEASPMPLNKQRIYDQIKQNSSALEVRRSEIVSTGVLK